MSTPILTVYPLVRAVLGDFNAQFKKYEDSAILSVVKTVVMLGKVPGYALGPDAISIVPDIGTPQAMALLTYHAAKMFVMPNVADYGYRTRALQERFGRQDHFIFDLQNAIYELENPAMFSSFQSFYGWVNSLTGVDVWSLMTEMKTVAPVASVTIGRAGLTVSTT